MVIALLESRDCRHEHHAMQYETQNLALDDGSTALQLKIISLIAKSAAVVVARFDRLLQIRSFEPAQAKILSQPQQTMAPYRVTPWTAS
jgi:hypothetical protein